MNLSVFTLLVLAVVVVSNAEPQFGYGGYYPFPNYFRGGFPQPSYDEPVFPYQARQFPSITVTIATTTSTSTITTSTTCTTTTAAIKACSPSGRRRRGMALTGDRKGRGLFYNEENNEDEHGSIFLPLKPVEVPVKEEQVRETREASPVPVPYVIQPGFEDPEGFQPGRFLVAFGTKTITTSTTSTYTATLTAVCSSTTGFSSCSGSSSG